ncbi:MAG TPA: iron-sulfur cluster assembly accessory protein [Acidiphilium sp.]|nr:MAG: Fe-S cluster assembly protein HesB [Acidiphilium sp. 21-60-14]OYV90953.1 MAG: Fe-S cluster assembly protein HesB [Acidiphilium sp. 37-60-79]OZB38923.1 MAG: Fe-S cluster assembly protein HesB [Acidiphilium sp. 34-60-192]HQT88629.1 iron-sulfur cluster assembly accessory protein [Acidiphilium sp.]HQU23972.1 iron-sulfur cluster assembly accessory protein [Acidiphilium sp.]
MDKGEKFRISDAAAKQVAAIAAGAALRVEVLAGGCNGFQYKFDLTDAVSDEDIVVDRNGARVVIDPTSLELLDGAELDYKDTLMGSYFAVQNPNAKTSCGCGTSFSVD